VRRRFAVLLLVLGSAAVSLLAAELAFRFYDIGWAALSYEQTKGVVRLGRAGVLEAADHPGIRFELKPDLDQGFKLARLRTNSVGLHDREVSRAKPPGTYRVAVLGDSQTMASGVDRDEAWHALLEERADVRAVGFDRIEFVNFAIGASTPGDYRDILEHKVLGYDPDLVVVGFTPGNDEIFNWSETRRQFRPKEIANGFFQSFVLRRIEDLWSHYLGGESFEERGEFRESHRDLLQRLFRDMKTRSGAVGASLVVVYLARVDRENRAAVEALMQSLGIPFLDTSPAFHGVPLDRTRIYRSDRHPNAEAHARIAEYVRPWLKAIIAASASPPRNEAANPGRRH